MTLEMHADAALLNELLDEAPPVYDNQTGLRCTLSAKLIAHWADLSVQTVSDYRTGNLNIPVRFWRRIMGHYPDPRIVALVTPDNVYVELYHVAAREPATGPDIFKRAVANEMDHAEMQKMIAELLADGRVDELDAKTIKEYDQKFAEHRMRDYELHASIMATYKHAKRRAEASV